MQQLIAEIKAMQNAYMSFDWQNTVCYTADADFPNYQYDSLAASVLCDGKAVSPIEGVDEMSADRDMLLGYFKDEAGRQERVYAHEYERPRLRQNGDRGNKVCDRGRSNRL